MHTAPLIKHVKMNLGKEMKAGPRWNQWVKRQKEALVKKRGFCLQSKPQY